MRRALPTDPEPSLEPAARPSVWLVAVVVAAWLLVGLGWAILTPTFAGVDEGAHTALVVDVRSQRSYPLDRTGFEPRTAALFGWVERATVDGRYTEVVPARADRPTFSEPGPVTSRRGVNQMTQHPPLPYVGTAVALAVGDAWADLDRRSFDVEVLALRLLHVVVTASAAFGILAAARRLGLSPGAQVVAAVLPLTVPQLFHVAGAVGNDGWLVAASAATSACLAAVCAGDRRVRTAALLGILVSIAALTKAFGLLLVGAVAAAYALGPVLGGWRARLRLAAVALGVTVVGSGWWWIGNLLRTGALQPQGAPLRGQAAPPGFDPEQLDWYERFASWMTVRYWGWFGEFALGQRIPVGLVAAATIVAAGLLVAAVALGRGAVLRFTVVALGLHAVALLVVGWEARQLYLDTALPNGIQGRYLYVALPALAVAAAAGGAALASRHRVPAALARPAVVAPALALAVVVMQASAAGAVLQGSWGAPESSWGERVRAVRGWAPVGLGTTAVLAAGAVVVAVGVAHLRVGRSGRVTSGPPG